MNTEFFKTFFIIFFTILVVIAIFFGIIWASLYYLGDFWGMIALFILSIAVISALFAYFVSKIN